MRFTSMALFASLIVACGPDDGSTGSPTSAASTTGNTGGAAGSSTGGAAGSTSTTSGSSGRGGSAGATGGSAGGTAGSGTAGSAGTGGGGGSGGGGTDGGATDGASDSGMPKSDAARDAISSDGPSKSRQTARPINMPYAKNGYWEYLPPGYGDGTKRPLLVFWHGIGENGSGNASDLMKVLAHGPPKLINLNQWPATRPFVVLSPQHTPPGAQADCPAADEIHDFITFALGNYDIDTTRVYLTGLSCGALGSWSYLGKYQGQQVVAASLIAGDSTRAYNTAGCALLNTVALWTFHGDADQSVLVGPDTTGMNNFKACPGMHKDALYDILVGADHQRSWEIVYDLSAMKDIYAWMLAQHR